MGRYQVVVGRSRWSRYESWSPHRLRALQPVPASSDSIVGASSHASLKRRSHARDAADAGQNMFGHDETGKAVLKGALAGVAVAVVQPSYS